MAIFRYAHEPELKQAARQEWERLETLIAALRRYKVPGTDLGKMPKNIQLVHSKPVESKIVTASNRS